MSTASGAIGKTPKKSQRKEQLVPGLRVYKVAVETTNIAGYKPISVYAIRHDNAVIAGYSGNSLKDGMIVISDAIKRDVKNKAVSE